MRGLRLNRSGRAVGRTLLIATIAALFITFSHLAAGASALVDSRQDQVEAWLADQGGRIVKEVLLTDADWASQLGLTADSDVSFGQPHRYLVIGDPDYDLATDTVQGELTIEAHILGESDYVVPVILDGEPVDLSMSLNTEGDKIHMTSLGEWGFTTDVSAIGADIDFIDDGPYGVYSYESGQVVPLNDTAEYHVPEPTPAPVFMEARAKRAAQHEAVSRVDGMMLGSGPSLFNPDDEELAEWDRMVAEALEEPEPSQNPWLTVLIILGSLVALVVAGVFKVVGIKALTADKENPYPSLGPVASSRSRRAGKVSRGNRARGHHR